MKFNLDISAIVTGLILAAVGSTVAFSFGAIVEFHDVKKKVARHESQLVVVSQIVCKYAIRDKLKDAEQICAAVIHDPK